MEVGDILVNSCNLLYGEEVLDNNALSQCQELSSVNIELKNDIEKKIFGENRTKELFRYYDFLNKINNRLSELDIDVHNVYKTLDTLDKYSDTESQLSEEQRNVNKELITKINLTLVEISEKLNELLLKRFNNTEHSQYNLLLNNYTKIDINNDKITNLNDTTLNRQFDIENEIYINNTYKLHVSVLTILIVIFLILCVVLYMIYFK